MVKSCIDVGSTDLFLCFRKGWIENMCLYYVACTAKCGHVTVKYALQSLCEIGATLLKLSYVFDFFLVEILSVMVV